ncbi:MAG TPA: sulfurtransferase TusA family protein [Porticoccaceae bacterium]|nr:sulfurtransferase TusA family protein [Porticoccaceae bacterium]
MSAGIDVDIEVDARNLLCPMPVIRCQGAADGKPPGTRIRVLATDPGALSDVPAWSRVNGHTVIEARDEGDLIVVVVEVGESAT